MGARKYDKSWEIAEAKLLEEKQYKIHNIWSRDNAQFQQLYTCKLS